MRWNISFYDDYLLFTDYSNNACKFFVIKGVENNYL